MFWNKKKGGVVPQVPFKEHQVSERLNDLTERVFKLEHPMQYMVGQVVKMEIDEQIWGKSDPRKSTGIILDSYIDDLMCHPHRVYDVFDLKLKRMVDCEESEIVSVVKDSKLADLL